jgi:flagellin-like protein
MSIKKSNHKGVSPIIATLLLIAIAVAAAVVTYAFITGFIGTNAQQPSIYHTYSLDLGSQLEVNSTVGNSTGTYLFLDTNDGCLIFFHSSNNTDSFIKTVTTYENMTIPNTPHNINVEIFGGSGYARIILSEDRR